MISSTTPYVLACGNGRAQIDLWKIVDLREHPDLERRFRAGRSGCYQVGAETHYVDEPLLIWQPHRVPQAVFVASLGMPVEEADAVCARLFDELSERLQAAGEELVGEVAIVEAPRACLPLFLSGDKNAREAAFPIAQMLSAASQRTNVEIVHTNRDVLSRFGVAALGILARAPPPTWPAAEWRQHILSRRDLLKAILSNSRTGDLGRDLAALDVSNALARYSETYELDDLAIAKRAATVLLRRRDFPSTPRRAKQSFLHECGRTFLAHYVRTGRGLNQARRCLDQASVLARNALERAEVSDSLAIGLRERFGHTGKLSLIEEAISLGRQAVRGSRRTDANRPAFLNTLSHAWAAKYRRTERIADLNAAIRCAQEAHRLTDKTHPDRVIFLQTLAERSAERHDRLHQLSDLEAAVAYAREAADLADASQKPVNANGLSRYTLEMYRQTSEECWMHEAVNAARDAVQATPETHPNRAVYLYGLSLCLGERFSALGVLADMHEAVLRAEQAVEAVDDEYADRPLLLNGLSGQLAQRFHRLGLLQDLEASLEKAEEALRLTPGSHAHRRDYLCSVAHLKTERFTRLGGIADLDRAIAAASEALSLVADDHADRADVLNTLAKCKGARFEATNDMADLDDAIADGKAAVRLTGRQETKRPLFLNDLANLHNLRHGRLGQRQDLDAAIKAIDEALNLVPAVHPDRAMYLNTYAANLAERFQERGDLADLQKSHDAAKDAIDACGPDDPSRSIYLNLAADRASARYIVSEDPEDLAYAVLGAEAAVKTSAFDHPHRAGYYNTLANALGQRFTAIGRLEDINAAVSAADAAIALTPYGHPNRPVRLNNMAVHRAARYRAQERPEDLAEANKAFRESLAGCRDIVANDPNPGRVAHLAGEVAREYVAMLWGAGDLAALACAIEAARGIRLRAELARQNRAPPNLTESQQAAYRHAAKAARVLRWQAEKLRIELAENASELNQKVLLKELRTVNAKLEPLKRHLRESETQRDMLESQAADFAALREIARRTGDTIVYLFPVDGSLGALWAIIHPASELRGPDALDVGAAPGCGPQDLRSKLMGDGNGGGGWLGAHRTWADMLSDRKASDSDCRDAEAAWFDELASTLTYLGERLLSPVAVRLSALNIRSVVLVPGGVLSAFPLHAAVTAMGQPFGETFTVRYAASAAVLDHAFAAAGVRRSPMRVVAIANPRDDLAFADGQIQSLQLHLPARLLKVRDGRRASKTWLCSNARRADYLELSTHAHFDIADPANSYFELAAIRSGGSGGRSVWRRRLRLARRSQESLSLGDLWDGVLALPRGSIISATACETGLIGVDPNLIEEQVGFATAFLSLGCSIVLTSFWAVSDFSTWLLMDMYYEALFRDGSQPGSAMRKATRRLRTMTREDVLVFLAQKAVQCESRIRSLDARLVTGKGDKIELRRELQQITQLSEEIRRETNRIGVDFEPFPFGHPYYFGAFGVHGADAGGPPIG